MVAMQEQLSAYVRTFPREILEATDAIYLYGSMARGDVSVDSDCDLLIAIRDCDDKSFERLTKATEGWHTELNCEFALYQISALKAMQKKGSLFLWHIKTEGIELFSNGEELKGILAQLPAYNGGAEAISEYAEIMKDIDIDNTDEIEVINYNLSVMSTLIRNICIICSYELGTPRFGRISPVEVCADHFGEQFPIDMQQYKMLYRYRVAVNRNKSMPHQADIAQYYNDWKRKTKKLLSLALSIVE